MNMPTRTSDKLVWNNLSMECPNHSETNTELQLSINGLACACMDRGGKASTMCPGQSFLQKIQSSCPKKLHADGNCSVLLSYYLYWLININYQLSICFHVRGEPLWHHQRNEVVLLPLVTTLYIPCCLEKSCQSRIMRNPTVSERSCWCL